MINELNAKLRNAANEQAAAVSAYSRASLAVEDETGSTAELAKAARELSAAEKRVLELRAAITAAETDAAVRTKAAQEAEAKTAKEELDAALLAMRAVAEEWDAAVDGLAAITQRLMESEQKIPAQARQGYRSLQRAKANALLAIEWKLRAWTGMRVPFFDDNMAKLVNHLPDAT